MADVIGQHPSSTGARRPCTTQHAPRRTVHRYYDPSTGEFLTVDPDVAETGQPYYYAGDDPVNATDPSGMDKINQGEDVEQCVVTLPICLAEIPFGAGPGNDLLNSGGPDDGKISTAVPAVIQEIHEEPSVGNAFRFLAEQWNTIVVPFAKQEKADFNNFSDVPIIGGPISDSLFTGKLTQMFTQINPDSFNTMWDDIWGAGAPEDEQLGVPPTPGLVTSMLPGEPIYNWWTAMEESLAVDALAGDYQDEFVSEIFGAIGDALSSYTTSTLPSSCSGGSSGKVYYH